MKIVKCALSGKKEDLENLLQDSSCIKTKCEEPEVISASKIVQLVWSTLGDDGTVVNSLYPYPPLKKSSLSLIHLLFVALSDDYGVTDQNSCSLLLGALGIVFCTLSFSGTKEAYIQLMWVNRTKRQHGVGSKLMSAALDTCWNCHCVSQVRLHTMEPLNEIVENYGAKANDQLEEAAQIPGFVQNWYVSLGFVRKRVLRHYYYVESSGDSYVDAVEMVMTKGQYIKAIQKKKAQAQREEEKRNRTIKKRERERII